MYEKYLGVRPQNDLEGVLQDIHWYSGSIGYFPTYALGNIYAEIFTEEIKRTHPAFTTDISSGSFSEILSWHQTHVHAYGMRYSGVEIVQDVLKKDFNDTAFLTYIKNKYLS